jgi:hypothetical protein
MNSHLEHLGLQGMSGHFVTATDAQVAELEKQTGFTLSESYKTFLKRFGASVFTENAGFRALETSPWAVDGVESFEVFYGISETPASDVRSVNRWLRNSIPSQTIAIGHDPGSSLILLSDTGEVLFFERDSGRTFRIAANFDGFVDSFIARHPTYGPP